MAKERVFFLQAAPAPALRAVVNRAARCQDVAELARLLMHRRGFALFNESEHWLAALQAVDAGPAGGRPGSPGPSPLRL